MSRMIAFASSGVSAQCTCTPFCFSLASELFEQLRQPREAVGAADMLGEIALPFEQFRSGTAQHASSSNPSPAEALLQERVGDDLGGAALKFAPGTNWT